jgi:hypothetical protein
VERVLVGEARFHDRQRVAVGLTGVDAVADPIDEAIGRGADQGVLVVERRDDHALARVVRGVAVADDDAGDRAVAHVQNDRRHVLDPELAVGPVEECAAEALDRDDLLPGEESAPSHYGDGR